MSASMIITTSPFVLVIFGATGDLARRKLIPALFSLFQKKELPKEFFIIGFARRMFSDKEFHALFGHVSKNNTVAWSKFVKHITYQQGEFDGLSGYEAIAERLDKFDNDNTMCLGRFFYLATPPDHYETILAMLAKTKLSKGCKRSSGTCTRIVVEKPFGKDLETAKALDKKLSDIFKEEQIFRVDHYLGKETVQNMIAFRFANGIFEPVWNKNYIDHIQITFAEEQGVADRGAFFDGVGILRDVAQNHLMQLIAAVTMEQPRSFSREGVRDARAAAIKAIRCIEPKDVADSVVRGQHNGYRNERDVAKESMTESFVAMKFFIDTERFSGIPFYVRAGKKMPKNVVEISLVFLQTCHILFKEYGCPEIGNVLTIRIQPDEGIRMRIIAKTLGTKLSLGTVDMKFSYHQTFGGHGGEAYEKILVDIFTGDQMLFNRSDELESSWEFITNILDGWKRYENKLHIYKEGTWGPKEADELIGKDGRKWL